MAPIRGYVFDAYGTLFDVHSVIEAGRAITADPLALSLAWRQKQLEYTWLRSLMGRYEDFWTVTEDALRWAIARLGLGATEADIRRLMDAYLSLACFPEVAAALASLAGRPRAILSNGAPDDAAAGRRVERARPRTSTTSSRWTRCKTYKPSPRCTPRRPGPEASPAADLLFVSSNAWDVAGAKSRLPGRLVQPHERPRRTSRVQSRPRNPDPRRPSEIVSNPQRRVRPSEVVSDPEVRALDLEFVPRGVPPPAPSAGFARAIDELLGGDSKRASPLARSF